MLRHVRLAVVATLVAILALSGPSTVVADECETFPATGHPLCGRFLQYWLAHGGLAQQGYPLSDVFLATDPATGQAYATQYFERARFEYHPENPPPNDVLLGLLGREQFLARYPGGQPMPTVPAPPSLERMTVPTHDRAARPQPPNRSGRLVSFLSSR
jgi:hypothetical protein